MTHNRKRLLIVDDELVVRTIIRKYLVNAGYMVVMAESGAAALARLGAESFDLVLTNHWMPEMTGIVLAETIKTRWPSLPVVMFTGAAPEEPVPCLDALLHKPDDLRQLVQSIQELLDRLPE